MKASPYAECNGEIYVKAKYAGMDFICLIIDGTPITRLGKSKAPWLNIDVAIQWHEKEIEARKGRWDRGVLDALIEAKRNFKGGRLSGAEEKLKNKLANT